MIGGRCLPDSNKTRRVSGYSNAMGCLAPMYLGRETTLRPMDNSELIRAAQQGDAAAFEQLVQQYDRVVLRVAIHLTGSPEDGQDIYQEAFLRAYRNLPRFRFECSFYTWIYRIVVNLCLDHLRHKRRHCQYSSTVFSTEGKEHDVCDQIADERAISSPERNLLRRIQREHIVRALHTLSPRERMVFELKHYHGMQLKTVAGILNTTEGTAKNTLFRATHKLRSQLSQIR
jgi:RNA polymerase sigma-70 factor, ECF subfamily